MTKLSLYENESSTITVSIKYYNDESSQLCRSRQQKENTAKQVASFKGMVFNTKCPLSVFILKVEIFEVLTGKEASKRKKNLAKYQVKKHLRLKMEPTCVL